MKKLISDYHFRRWLYGIAAAVLVLLAGQGIVDAVTQENIMGIVSAVLNLGGAGATVLAAKKAEPVLSDTTEVAEVEELPDTYGKHGDYTSVG